ncbi:hypothetical protein LINPERPRIM_LOCUS3246, partial [Linum perenne]
HLRRRRQILFPFVIVRPQCGGSFCLPSQGRPEGLPSFSLSCYSQQLMITQASSGDELCGGIDDAVPHRDCFSIDDLDAFHLSA